MKSILLFGYYGHGNFGDDLILETLAETLAQRYRVSAVVFSERHSCKTRELVEQTKLNLVPIRVIRRPVLSKFNALYQAIQTIREGWRHDALVFGGGTQIFETKKNGVLPLLNQAVFTTVLRRVSGKTIGHLFVGINKPKTCLGAFFMRRILAVSDFVVLRDKRSFDVCLELGMPAKKLFLAADTAYVRGTKERTSAENDQKKIGVSLFPYFTVVERDLAADEAFLARAIEAIKAETAQNPDGSELVFLGSQPGTGLDDIRYARRVADQIIAETGCGSVKFVDYDLDTEAMITALGQMDSVIAMRLHILISAALAGVPKILALPYQAKVVDEAKALGLPMIQDGVPTDTPSAATSGFAHNKEQCERALTWLDSILVDEQNGTDSK